MSTHVRWTFPRELTGAESRIAAALKRVGKFYVFLREIRNELFDDEFQRELAQAYNPRGTEPLPAALLAMVTLLQAYDQVGDADAVVTAVMDRRWQLVLDCLGADEAPFSQGALVKFRERMIAHDLDQKLLDRTVELAKRTGGFGWQKLRAALDSSPLLGAGRVLDTWNLIGRALSTVVTCAAKAVGIPRDQILDEANITLLSAPSLKAALDIDWDDEEAKQEALERLLAEVDAIERWVANNARDHVAEPALRNALEMLRRVLAQDIEPDPATGRPRIVRGVAKDRLPSLGDPEMRHGRKNKTRPFNGYKRHFIKLLEPAVIVGAVVLPANEPEHTALEPLADDVQRHGRLDELLMDRGYLASPTVGRLRTSGTQIRSKAWKNRNGDLFTKDDFEIDLIGKRVTCPAGNCAEIKPGASGVRFAPAICAACELRDSCTHADRSRGRSVAIHPQEQMLIQLRAATKTPDGRALLRERTAIEHSLASVGNIQGPRARYKGTRKNTLDARRCASVDNLQAVARLKQAA